MQSNESTQPDEALVERIRKGDDRALGEAYDRHAGMVLAVARSITREDADAEEVTENVFLHLWRNASDFDASRGTLRSWLGLMARSRSIDRIRSIRRRRDAVERSAAASPEPFAAPVSIPGPSPEAEAVRHDVRASLDGLMKILSAEQRETIELAFFHGLTQSEIATRVGAPLGTVKTRMRDGMSKLRATAQADGLPR